MNEVSTINNYPISTNVIKNNVVNFRAQKAPISEDEQVDKFIKEAKKGVIISAGLDGKVLDAKETEKLASLPSKEELYAKMLGSINSPASGIVGAVNAVMSGLVRAMDQVAKQKAAS